MDDGWLLQGVNPTVPKGLTSHLRHLLMVHIIYEMVLGFATLLEILLEMRKAWGQINYPVTLHGKNWKSIISNQTIYSRNCTPKKSMNVDPEIYADWWRHLMAPPPPNQTVKGKKQNPGFDKKVFGQYQLLVMLPYSNTQPKNLQCCSVAPSKTISIL